MSPLNLRRWNNFKKNRRAKFSLLLFGLLFIFSSFAELIANDKPILIFFNGNFYWPITSHYTERHFGGEFDTEAEYRSLEVQCLILSEGKIECLDDPEKVFEEILNSRKENRTIFIHIVFSCCM